MLAGGIGWFLSYRSSRNTDQYQCSIVFEANMRMKKKIPSLFLYTTKEELIKENLHFVPSSPETTTHLGRITGKKKKKKEFLRRNQVSFLKQVFPKRLLLGCLISNFWCLKRITFYQSWFYPKLCHLLIYFNSQFWC